MLGETPYVTVRALRAADQADWRRLWTGYLRFYETSVTEAVFQTTFARLLSGDPHEFHGLIAEVDGKAVGLAHYLFHRHAWKIDNVCYLQDLYADPDMRGKGVGQALIQAVFDAADANGTPGVYWLTQDFNTQARKLYDRIGKLSPFIRYGRY